MLSDSGIMSASVSGYTSGDKTPLMVLRHFMTQPAIDPQSSMALPHGSAAGGQQSCIGSGADISAASCDFSLKAAPAPIGSMATDSAIRIANMVRANAILQRTHYPAAAGGWSSDDFAR